METYATSSTPADRFLDTVSRPFADNAELQVHVGRELEARIDPSHKDDPAWTAATAALEAGDHRPWWRRCRFQLWMAVLMVATACLTPALIEALALRDARESSPYFELGVFWTESQAKAFREKISENLAADQQLILFGDVSKKDAARWEAVWRRFPENPAYFAQYACAYALEHSSLPPDFLATAAKIDPDNAWFPAFAASVRSRGVVNYRKQTQAEIKAHAPRQWDVLDEPRLVESMALVHDAALLPRFDSYARQLQAEKMALLPPTHDRIEHLLVLSFASAQMGGSLYFQNVSTATAAKSWLLANQGDRDGFRNLLTDWTRLAFKQTESSDGLIEFVVIPSGYSTALVSLSDAATRLGLTGEAARLKEAALRAIAVSDARRSREAKAVEEEVQNHGGVYANVALPFLARQTENAPIPGDAELEAGRRVDQALAHRMLCVALFPVIGLISGACALYRFRAGRLPRVLSARMADALGPADWAWLFGAAVLPSVYLVLLHGLTPLGGKGWGYANPGIVVQEFQLIAWAVLTVTTPAVVATWRLRGRFPGMALTTGNPLWAGIIVATGYLATTLSGLYYLRPRGTVLALDQFLSDNYLWPPGMEWPVIATVAALPLLIWWFSNLVRAAFTGRDGALGRLVISRMLIPAWIFLLIPVALLALVFKAQERHWVSRGSASGADFDLNRYEKKITRLMQQDVLQILEPLGKFR